MAAFSACLVGSPLSAGMEIRGAGRAGCFNFFKSNLTRGVAGAQAPLPLNRQARLIIIFFF